MKKLILFLIVGMFMISLTSALEIDDFKTYDLDKKEYTLTNAFGLGENIATISLDTPLNFEVGLGYQKVAEMTFTNGENDYSIINGIELYNIKDGMREIIRDVDYKYKTIENIDIYRTECNNKTGCEEVYIKTEEREKWLDFNENTLTKDEIITIGLFTDVKIGDHVEWIPNVYGNERLTEWAAWAASLEVGLQNWYKMDESSGVVIDAFGNINATNTGATPNVVGKIETAYNFSYADNDNIIANSNSGITGSVFSMNAWGKKGVETGNHNTIMSLGNWSAGNTATIQWGNAGAQFINIVVHSGGNCEASFDSGLDLTQWRMYTYTHDGSTCNIYIDGVSVFNGSQGVSIVDRPFYIGTHNNGGQEANGVIDEVGLWNRTLTTGDIAILYDGGAGTTYSNVVPTITLNSPDNDSSFSTNEITFNATASDDTNLINVSLYLDGVLNETNTTGINNSNYIFTKTITEGSHNWSITACDVDGNCPSSSIRIYAVDVIFPLITVESPSGVLGVGKIGNNEKLNVTFTDTNLDTCWYDYNGSNITIPGCLTGVKNSTTFALESDNTNMTIYTNDTAGNKNSTYINWSYTYFENNRTHNSSSYQTASETFTINVTGATTAALFYNGTEYTTTKSGNTYTRTIQIPATTLGNITAYWRFDDTQNSFNSYQNVSETIFALCNSSLTTPFLNITFQDEGNSSRINAEIPTSTFVYYLGDGTVTKTLTYINNTANFNYDFCASPNRTLNVDSIIQYKQGTLYPQRVADPSVIQYTNTTTNTTLSLLTTADGIFVTFQVINSAEQTISGVLVTAERLIGIVNTVVGVGTTGDSGSVTLWLNPDFSHDFNFTKSGLPSFFSSFAPTQTSYTITMGETITTQNSTIKGIDYSVIPTNKFLENDTTYTFGFNLTSSFWDITEYGFDLRLANGTIITGDTSTTSGTSLTKSYDVSNQSIIYLDAFWNINGNYTNITRTWGIQNTAYLGWSIKTFFTDLTLYLNSGMFGLDNFGRYLIAFMIIFVSVGLMGHKFGIVSPLGITSLIFGMILFFDVITGVLPTIRGIQHLPTFISGLILTLSIINEVQSR